MKIRILSDLHLEFGKIEIVALPDDMDTTLILAGDIHVGTRAFDFVTELCARFRNVIYILGNHEFYGHDVPTIVDNWRYIAKNIDNLQVLEKDYVVVEDTIFIGGTMWTDLNNGDRKSVV